MHSVQLNPNLKFIVNLKNCVHPYASVGMVWNVLNESHVKANGITLPEMSIKPYVEYGVGIQKHWSDKFSAFGQVMLRGGGRKGVALSGGFRWAIGRDSSQKVNQPSENLKVSSSINTTNKKIIKRLI
jgi:outer membrane autotransporter protein